VGDLPVAIVDTAGTASTVNYITADGLGTPRVVTNGSGTTVWSWSYQSNPFGEQQPTSSTGYVFNLRFPGQYYDAESGLAYNVNRDYEAATGRYVQSDPLGTFGGQASTYGYVSNGPLQYSDPVGLWVCDGSVAQCTSFKNGLKSVKEASASGDLEPYQQGALANIVNTYGEEWDSRVHVKFGSLGPGIDGATSRDKENGCEVITFDDSKLKDPLVSKYLWGSTVAHEGQHASDDISGDVNNASTVSRYDTEVNAYTSEAYYYKGVQISDPSGFGKVWSLSGGIDYNAIQQRAWRSVNYVK